MKTRRNNMHLWTKTLACLVLATAIQQSARSQDWSALGPDDRNWPSPTLASYLSCAADGLDRLVVAYEDHAHGQKLTVMERTIGAGWQPIGSPGISSGFIGETSMALDALGNPVVAFSDGGGSGPLTVMRWDGFAWNNVGGTDVSAGAIASPSLTVDASGDIYVAYRDLANGNKATVLHWDGFIWAPLGGAGFTTGTIFNGIDMAMSVADTPVIAFKEDGVGGRVMGWDGVAWVPIGGIMLGTVNGFVSLAMDASDFPVVAYRDASPANRASSQRWNGTSWEQVGVPGELSVGQASYIDIILGAGDQPLVTFKDDGVAGGKVVVVKWNSIDEEWVTTGADGLGFGFASHTCLAKDDIGVLFLVHNDAGVNSKATAWRSTNGGDSWQPVGAVGFSEDYAKYPGMTLDENGEPVVVYADMSQGGKASVKRWNGTSWDLVGTSGFSDGAIDHPDIAVDASGVIYVAYSDQSHGFAITVQRFDGTWSVVGLPNFSDGATNFISMDLDALGRPVVSYRDYAHSDGVTVERFNGSNFVEVGAKGFSGGLANYASLVMDASDNPVVAFSDGTAGNKASVMSWDGISSWNYVDAAGISAGAVDHCSMRMDGSGNIYVAYVAQAALGSARKPTVMFWNGSTWSPVGGTGFGSLGVDFVSLALDPAGMPVIASVANTFADRRAIVQAWDGSSWNFVGPNRISATVNDEEPGSWLEVDDHGRMVIAYGSGHMYAKRFGEIPCTEYILELQSDAGAAGDVTYEVLDESGTTVVLSGNNPIPASSIGTVTLCLPDGCYELRVTDAAGDGLLGYVLRETGMDGRRIIDNKMNMNDGVSQISGGHAFCLPLGTARPIWSSCDKLHWVQQEFIVNHADAAVSAQYGVTNTTSGYEFWFFDPNGTYSYRRFRSHATSDGYGAGATRACHFKINGWINTLAAPHIPSDILLNVRVRGRVAGVNQNFGPACQFKIDAALAACPTVELQDDPANPEDYSCGVSRNFGGPSSPANRIYADPPKPTPSVPSNMVRYQFRFRITGEGVCIVRPPQASARMVLNWTTGTPLECSKTYEVDVRVSLDGGATWCFGPAGSSEAIACADTEEWGRVCNVTINPCSGVSGGTSQLIEETNASSNGNGQGEQRVVLHPNPNRGDQLYLRVGSVEEGVTTVNVDIYDLTGKRVAARTIAVQDGFVKTNLELNGELAGGMYMVNITAGDKTYTERLVIQP